MLLIGKLSIVKMSVSSSLSYRLNAISIKNLSRSFLKVGVGIGKLILKFIQEYKGLKTDKTIFKKNKVGEFIFPDFKNYWYINRKLDRTEYPETELNS